MSAPVSLRTSDSVSPDCSDSKVTVTVSATPAFWLPDRFSRRTRAVPPSTSSATTAPDPSMNSRAEPTTFATADEAVAPKESPWLASIWPPGTTERTPLPICGGAAVSGSTLTKIPLSRVVS